MKTRYSDIFDHKFTLAVDAYASTSEYFSYTIFVKVHESFFYRNSDDLIVVS